MSGWVIRHDLGPGHFEQVFAFYRHEWWCQGRREEDVRAAFAASALVVVVDPRTDEAVAVARAVTDGRFQCLVNDVICRPDLRGRGLGELLLRELIAHPALAGVIRMDLVCLPELDGFYARYGFGDPAPSHLLRRLTPPNPSSQRVP